MACLEKYIIELIDNKTIDTTAVDIESIVSAVIYEDYPQCFKLSEDEVEFLIDSHDVVGKLDFFYLIKNKDNYDYIYAAMPDIHPKLWYCIENIGEFDIFMKDIFYNKTMDKNIRAFIGTTETLNLTFESLQNYVLISAMTEKYMWGPLYDDYPFRDDCKNMSGIQYIQALNESLRQPKKSTKKFSVRSKYSKSIISFMSYEDLLYLDITYGETIIGKEIIEDINEAMSERYYPCDIPMDVLAFILPFPMATMGELLEMDPPQIRLALNVASTEELQIQLLEWAEKMYKNSKHDETTMNDMKNVVLLLGINKEINRIITEIKIEQNMNNDSVAKYIFERCVYDKKILDKKDVYSHIKQVVKMLNLFDQT